MLLSGSMQEHVCSLTTVKIESIESINSKSQLPNCVPAHTGRYSLPYQSTLFNCVPDGANPSPGKYSTEAKVLVIQICQPQ